MAPLSIYRQFWQGGVAGAVDPFAGALIRLDERSPVGATQITKMTNFGTGGDAYSPNTVHGTAANLIPATINGLRCVESDGSAYINTSASQSISGSKTVYLVGRCDDASAAVFLSSNTVGGWHAVEVAGTSKYQIYQGANLPTLGNNDQTLHTWVIHFNQGVTSSLEVDGETIIGTAGTIDPWTWGTMFAQYNGGRILDGVICEVDIFNSDESAADDALRVAALNAKWGST